MLYINLDLLEMSLRIFSTSFGTFIGEDTFGMIGCDAVQLYFT